MITDDQYGPMFTIAFYGSGIPDVGWRVRILP